MLLAHAAYTAWFNVDLLLVDHFLGLAAAGNYALSRTITMIFVFVPYATTTVVLPRFVHMQARNGVAYLRATLLASAATSALLLALVGVAGRVVLRRSCAASGARIRALSGPRRGRCRCRGGGMPGPGSARERIAESG